MSYDQRASQTSKITPIGLGGSLIVVGGEIGGEEIDKHTGNLGDKPFQNATDASRTIMTFGPLIANIFLADNTKAGRVLDGITRPVTYGAIPLFAKSVKFAIWTWMGKPAGSKTSGVDKRNISIARTRGGMREDVVIVRGRGVQAAGGKGKVASIGSGRISAGSLGGTRAASALDKGRLGGSSGPTTTYSDQGSLGFGSDNSLAIATGG